MMSGRLASIALTCSRGGLKFSLQNPILPSQRTNLAQQFTRSYREGGRSGFRGRTRGQGVQEQVEHVAQGVKTKYGPLEVGQIAAGGGALVGLGALCFYGLGLSSETGAIDRMVVWPKIVRDRVRDTYMYFGASCATIAASSVALYRSPLAPRYIQLCARHPIMSTVGIIALLVGTGQAMMSIPYSPGFGAKQAMWLVNCGMLALVAAPLGALGGTIMIRAGWYTAGIVGGLSTVAMCAPSDKFLTWGGPLGLALGGVFVASIGSAFLPPTSALGLGLYSISLYGGLLLFSGFLLYDTQKIIHKAENTPNHWGVQPYDPINASHHIVMDALNIFIRIAQILGMAGGGRRK